MEERHCPSCGASVSPAAIYCLDCGKRLDGRESILDSFSLDSVKFDGQSVPEEMAPSLGRMPRISAHDEPSSVEAQMPPAPEIGSAADLSPSAESPMAAPEKPSDDLPWNDMAWDDMEDLKILDDDHAPTIRDAVGSVMGKEEVAPIMDDETAPIIDDERAPVIDGEPPPGSARHEPRPPDIDFVATRREPPRPKPSATTRPAPAPPPLPSPAASPFAHPVKCPRCDARLAARAHGPYTVHECDRCGGAFADREQFDRLRKLKPEVAANATLRELRQTVRRFQIDEGVRYAKCPVCRQMMNRYNFGGGSGVMIDRCAAHGVWFDAGELDKVQAFVASGGLVLSRLRERLDEADERRPPRPAWVERHAGLRAKHRPPLAHSENALDVIFSLFK